MNMITEHLKFADLFPDKATEFASRFHIKEDEIPFVRKYYTAEKESEVDKEERSVISYISTGIKDRDGEMLLPEGVDIENYRKNPIVPFGHDYSTIPPAKNAWIKRDEKGLIAKTVFAANQRADEYYRAYTEDVGGTGPLLNSFSVGFIPIEWEDTEAKALERDPSLPKRTYNKWELLEYSLVPVPSCSEALTIAVEKGVISERLQKELGVDSIVPNFQPAGGVITKAAQTFAEIDLQQIINDKLRETDFPKKIKEMVRIELARLRGKVE